MNATFERRCRSCGKWSTVEVTGTLTHPESPSCPFCKADYGPIDVGDKLVTGDGLVNPAKWKGGKVYDAPTKLPPPGPGEEGYVPSKPKKGASS